MSFELGGRADKLGNDFENRYLVNLFLRLLRDEYESIEVEPVGPIDDGVEYIAVLPNQSKVFFQCKGSNADQDSWRISDLNKYHIFDKAKRHLKAHPQNQYWFVSPCKYGQLDELCHRARSNHSLSDFIEYQLNTDKLQKLFAKCRVHFGCSDNEHGEAETLSLLARCHFVHYAFDEEAKMQLNDQIHSWFMGKADSNRIIIANLVNDLKYYGRAITAAWLLNELKNRNVVRYTSVPENIWEVVSEINRGFDSSYLPMNGKILERTVTNELLSSINTGESVILLGKPGAGKSGVLCSLMDHLNSQSIPHLAIKLNKDVSQSTCDEFGAAIGLPFSPVECLRQLAGGQTAVLMLDQLDSLRWTEGHSAKALGICKELIRQAGEINKNRQGKISIVFACRSFDLEIDPMLRSLFCDTQTTRWEKRTVDVLTETEVISVIGSTYQQLPARLKTMLRTPATLSVWLHLSNEVRIKMDSISSADQLIDAWWQEILGKEHCPSEALTTCIEEIVRLMQTHGRQYVPRQVVQKYSRAINVLLSEQLLVQSENAYMFVHQSYYDFFLVNQALMDVYCGKSALGFLPPYATQPPGGRYRLLALLQRLLSTDEEIFLHSANELLASNQVRYYYQCAVFEVIGQTEQPSRELQQFVQQHYADTKWQKYIVQVVFMHHPAFIRHVDEIINDDWLDELHLDMLRSIVSMDSEFVLSKLEPYAGKSAEIDQKLWHVLDIGVIELSEEANQFALRLAQNNPKFLQTAWGITRLIEKESPYSIDYLLILLQHCEDDNFQNIYLGDSNHVHWNTEDYHRLLLAKLLPALADQTSGWNTSSRRVHNIFYEHSEWIKEGYRTHVSRAIVDLLIAAAKKCACTTPECYISMLNEYGCTDSYVVNEVLMEGISNLPLEYGNEAFEWIFADFDHRIFVYTGDQEDYLRIFKQVIKRFGASLNQRSQTILDKTVYSWHEPNEVIKATLEARKSRNHEYGMVFCGPPYWGHLQYELIPLLPFRTANSEKLMASLQRNVAMYNATTFKGTFITPARSVTSPLHGRADQLTDAAWLRLMQSEVQPKSRWRESKDGQYFIESNHPNFASAMEDVVVQQPNRFIRLAMQMTSNCDKCYLYAVLRGLARSNLAENDLRQLYSLLQRCMDVQDQEVVRSVLSLLEKTHSMEWPSFVDDYLCKTALSCPADEDALVARLQKSTEEGDLHTVAVNTANGRAMGIICKRLAQKADMFSVYKPVVGLTMAHKQVYMHYMAAECLVAMLGHEENWALQQLKLLLQQEPTLLVSYDVRQVVLYDYSNNAELYRRIVIDACNSTDDALATEAAGCLCALAYYCTDDTLRELLMVHPWSHSQIERICRQALHFLSVPNEHDYAIDLFMQHPEWLNEVHWRSIFRKNMINLNQDVRFIQMALEKSTSVQLAKSFIEYAEEADDNFAALASCICTVCNKLDSYDQGKLWPYNLDDLLHVLLRLCDQCKDQPEVVDTCLTAMDKLFQSDCMRMHNLSARIDEETFQ